MIEGNPMYSTNPIAWDWCMKYCDHSKIALDIGANDGGYISAMIGNGFNVIAFEPVPDMFDKCCERFLGDSRVVINNIGVSDKSGWLKNITVLSAWTLGDSKELGLDIALDYKEKETFDVQLVTLDETVGDLKIGFIKLDVDGYEFKVLRGAEKLLLAQKPPILCEFSCYIEGTFKEKVEDFINYIFFLGYDIMSMDGLNVFNAWEQVKPYYPYNTSFDVMLIPKHLTSTIQEYCKRK